MITVFKYRIYPTEAQKQHLLQEIGNCRFVWNKLVESQIVRYKAEKKFNFANDMWKIVKQLRKEFTFLNHGFKNTQQQVIRKLERSLRQVKSHSRGFVKFHKKSSTESVHYPIRCAIGTSYVMIPGLVNNRNRRQKVKAVIHRPVEGTIKNCSVIREVDQWFVCVCCEQLDKTVEPKTEGDTIGVDLGLTDFATCSDRTVIKNPRHLKKSLKKLARQNKKLAKKKKGSQNFKKQVVRLAKVHRKIKRQRHNFHHQTARRLIAKASCLCVESLSVANMVKNRKLARSISDAGWSGFLAVLQQKAAAEGVRIVEADRWYPSTKTCSICGHVQDMPLSTRMFVCEGCGMEIQRDFNAAMNLRRLGNSRT